MPNDIWYCNQTGKMRRVIDNYGMKLPWVERKPYRHNMGTISWRVRYLYHLHILNALFSVCQHEYEPTD